MVETPATLSYWPSTELRSLIQVGLYLPLAQLMQRTQPPADEYQVQIDTGDWYWLRSRGAENHASRVVYYVVVI